MKKWLLILSIIFTVSFISCTVLAGRVYYKDLRTYNDYDKKELDQKALDNIFIKSYIPVDIYPTTDRPYAEFNQTFIDLVGLAPKYELKVETKGNSTYINLNELGDIFLSLGVKENRARLTVYLPQQTINRLSIQNPGFLYSNKETQIINLENINIKELEAKMNHVEFILSGKYENVNLRAEDGKLAMDSKSRAQLYVDGNIEQNLSGEFEKIVVKNNNCDISADSTLPCNIQIHNDNSNMRLKGSYSRINIVGDGNNIDLNTVTEGKLTTKGFNNHINGNGVFNEISLSEENSEIELQNNMIPDKIQLGGCSMVTNITLTLPSNIPGFRVRYAGAGKKLEKDEYEVYQNYLLEGKDIQSDFKLNSSISQKGELLYTYGDGSIPITLSESENVAIEIIDGGYSSRAQ